MSAIVLALTGIFLLLLDVAVVSPSAARFRRRVEWVLPVAGCAVVICAVVLAFLDGPGLVLA